MFRARKIVVNCDLGMEQKLTSRFPLFQLRHFILAQHIRYSSLMKRGFFAVAKSKSDGDGDGGGEKNETGAVVVRPATFSTLPTDTSTTLHWSFYVPVSSSSSSAVIRASPLTPIAEVALGMTTASIKLLKPHTAFQHPMPSVPLTWECREVKGKGTDLFSLISVL